MKLNFFAVYTQDWESGKKLHINLKSILDYLIDNNTNFLKIEDLYICCHRVTEHVYTITKSYDSELVKKVNKKTISIDDLRESLENDESLGFPSFLFIDGNIIGYASSLHGPRVRELGIFLQERCGISKSRLSIEPLMQNVTKADALKMGFIGRTTLRIESKSNKTFGLLKFLGAQDVDEDLLDGIEITIKPKKNKNIKKITADVINALDSESSIKIKGKQESADLLTEFYLSDKGHIGVNLHRSSNNEIAEEMVACFYRMKHIIMDSYENSICGKINQ